MPVEQAQRMEASRNREGMRQLRPGSGIFVPVDNPSNIAKTPAKASTEPQKQAPALARQLPRRGTPNTGYDNWRSGLAERRAKFRDRRAADKAYLASTDILGQRKYRLV